MSCELVAPHSPPPKLVISNIGKLEIEILLDQKDDLIFKTPFDIADQDVIDYATKKLLDTGLTTTGVILQMIKFVAVYD